MTISDIITILSLVIAIVAIISEKSRKHLLLKYSWIDFSFYIVLFSLINYFVFYDELYSSGYYIKFLYFDSFGLKNPNNYAYIFSLISLLIILIKINYAFYPFSKIEQVLKYYKSLIENNEIQFLLDLIEKHHLKDIVNQVKNSKDHDPNSKDWLFERFQTKSLREKMIVFFKNAHQHLLPFSRINKYYYAELILNNIINDPAFIALSSNIRPYLFADIISTFTKTKRNSFPDNLVNQFLTEIIENKNFWLKKELKQSDNFDVGQPNWFFEDNRIIASLIENVSVADVNEIWKPFGESAIREIENESYIGTNSRLFQVFRNDDVLWEYKCFISIKFINILIIEAIVQKYEGSHFWLFYYWHITKKILKNLTSDPDASYEKTETNYHHLILEMNSYLFHWLDLSNKHESKRIYHDILICIGEQIHDLLLSNYFGEERKKDLLEGVLRHYCHFDEKSETNKIRSKIESILLKPCMLTEENHPYYKYINEVWIRLDKVPYRLNMSHDNDREYFARLKEKVIVPLGLNPQAF